MMRELCQQVKINAPEIASPALVMNANTCRHRLNPVSILLSTSSQSNRQARSQVHSSSAAPTL